jgi:hypothetical protein
MPAPPNKLIIAERISQYLKLGFICIPGPVPRLQMLQNAKPTIAHKNPSAYMGARELSPIPDRLRRHAWVTT